MEKDIYEITERFNNLIPSHELDLIVLKGHLLVEEILEDILNHFWKNNKYIKNCNLVFFKKLCISASLVPEFPPSLYDAVKLLNEVRNSLAHKLEPQNYEEKIDRLIGMFEKGMCFVSEVNKELKLKSAIAIICANLVFVRDKLN